MERVVLVQEDPVTLRLPAAFAARPDVQRVLTVQDRSAKYELARWKKAAWRAKDMGADAWKARERELEERSTRSLVYQDALGLWTPSGCAQALSELPGVEVRRGFDLPEAVGIPWARTPQQEGLDPRPHQYRAVDAFLEAGHGVAEYCVAAGKSLCVAMLCQRLGRRALVTVYSGTIARQLYAFLRRMLGSRYVGMFDGETKEIGKMVTVCTAVALSNVQPGSAAWEHFSEAELLVGDEAHTFGADTLVSLALGVARKAPYRCFLSGSLTRSDGLDPLMRAVVGPTVATFSFREGVEKGVLAKPRFGVFKVRSRVSCGSGDPDRLTRAHLYENLDVAAAVARLASAFRSSGYVTLFLVDEYPQVQLLLQHVPGALVLHGNTAGAAKLPEAVRECDSGAVVSRFNEGGCDLVSTSAGRVGIDFRPPQPMLVVNLVGNTSEVALVQGVGRGARRQGKDHFWFVDVRVDNVDRLARHADARAEILTRLYEEPVEIEF